MSNGYIGNEELKNIIMKLQSKTATSNGTVKPDMGFDGLSEVKVDVEGAEYVLPVATNDILGGVKSSTAGTEGTDYPVEVNPDGTMRVNIPSAGGSSGGTVYSSLIDNGLTDDGLTTYSLSRDKINPTEGEIPVGAPIIFVAGNSTYIGQVTMVDSDVTFEAVQKLNAEGGRG